MTKKFNDGIWRYYDGSLWRRYIEHLDKDGNPKKGWGSTGEIKEDKVNGKYFTTTKGIDVYLFEKPKDDD